MKNLKTKIAGLFLVGTITFFISLAWAADTSVTNLTELATAPAGTDLVYIVDGGVSKKISVTNLHSLLQTALTNEAGLYAALSDVTNFLQTGDAIAGGDITANSVGESQLLESMNFVPIGDFDHGGGVLQIPNSTTLPGTCEIGDTYMDTDATTGQRLYLCESANTWALQGDGGGAPGANSIGESELDESMNFDPVGEWDFGAGGIEIENGTTPPACTVGQVYLDTDATSGQQLMGCEGGTFVKQGDGSGSGMSNLLDDLTPQLGGPLDGLDEVVSKVQMKDYTETIGVATVSSGVLTVNLANGNVQTHTLSENVTEIDFTNITAATATTVTLILTQDATTPRTVAMQTMEIDSVSKTDLWSTGVPPTVSSGVSDIDIFTFVIQPASNRVFAFVGGQDFG